MDIQHTKALQKIPDHDQRKIPDACLYLNDQHCRKKKDMTVPG